MVRYEHRQVGRLIRVLLLAGAVVPAALAAVAPAPTPLLMVVVLAPLAALCFSTLTIRVTDRALEWAFGCFVRRSVPVAEVLGAEATRTRWYEGLGIHWTRRGWLYNVAGCDAVLVRLKSGRQVLLGTDEPEALAAAIRGMLSR